MHLFFLWIVRDRLARAETRILPCFIPRARSYAKGRGSQLYDRPRFFLWLRWERVNLMAVFLVWWLFAIMREMLRMRGDVTVAQTVSSLA